MSAGPKFLLQQCICLYSCRNIWEITIPTGAGVHHKICGSVHTFCLSIQHFDENLLSDIGMDYSISDLWKVQSYIPVYD